MKKVVRCPGCGERRQAGQVIWYRQNAPKGMPRMCGACCYVGYRAVLRAVGIDPDLVAVNDVPVSKFLQGLRQARQDELAVKRAVRQETWGTRERTRLYKFCGVEYEVLRRDHQRQRVYDAENVAFRDFPVQHKATVADAQRYADEVVASWSWAVISVDHGTKQTKVEVKGGKRSGAHACMGTISVSSWACARKHVMLHELAHCAAHYDVSHHWPFCNAYLKLVEAHLGKEWSDRLRLQFDIAGVQYNPVNPKPQSPGQGTVEA